MLLEGSEMFDGSSNICVTLAVGWSVDCMVWVCVVCSEEISVEMMLDGSEKFVGRSSIWVTCPLDCDIDGAAWVGVVSAEEISDDLV